MTHGKETNKLTQYQMVVLVKKDISKLTITILKAMTDEIKPEEFEGKNIAETQRKSRVRTIKNILKEKIETLDLLDRANKITSIDVCSK